MLTVDAAEADAPLAIEIDWDVLLTPFPIVIWLPETPLPIPIVFTPELVPMEIVRASVPFPTLTAAVSLSVARLRAVPAVLIVADASPVRRPVTVRLPGTTKLEEREKVIVLPEPAVAIWLAVPARVILPALGEIAPPLSPVKVLRAPVAVPKRFHVAVTAPFEALMATSS